MFNYYKHLKKDPNRRSTCFLRFEFLFILVVLVNFSIKAQNLHDVQKDSSSDFAKDSLVPVAFGVEKVSDMVLSYQKVDGDDLLNVPVSSVMGALYGRLAGLSLRQGSGAPGKDVPNESLRGMAPLIVVDGVPRDFTMMDLYQVSSVVVLKDAVATAIYGQRGQGGAILITTRRGVAGKAHISFTAKTGSLNSLTTPKLLNAYDYAILFNEGLVNSGQQPLYTNDDLSKYQNGSDPYGYPNVDWYHTVFKDKTAIQQYNLNISGGAKTARYFIDLDYLNQGGALNIPNDINTYPTTNYFKRYNFRTNLDLQLTKSTSATVDIFGRIQNGNEPGSGMDAIYDNVMSVPANAYPIFNPDGSLGGNRQYPNNIWGMITQSGYIPSYSRTLGMNLSIKQDLTFLKGLYATARGSFISYYDERTLRTKSIEVFDMNIDQVTGDTTYTKFGNTGTQTNTMSVGAKDRQIFYVAGLGYDAQFNSARLHADLLYNYDNYVNGSSLPVINQALLARVTLLLKDKYSVEGVANYGGLNRYATGKQWGAFPALGLGWDISRESWFTSSVINNLKLRTSYGLAGNNLSAGYFSYQQFYTNSSTFYKGNPPAGNSTVVEGTLANPNLTWEKSKKFNFGIDATLLNNKIGISADYFNNRVYDALIIRQANAGSILGATRPLENLGKYKYSGYELSVNYKAHTGDVSWFVTGNGALLQTKVINIDEGTWPASYLYRTGKPIGQPFGFIAEGFFQNQQEINNSPKVEGNIPQPGDLKYKDVNGDNLINDLDKTAITKGKPSINYGLTYGASWKGFDISMLWQGTANSYTYTNSSTTLGFQVFQSGYSQGFESNMGRWTSSNPTGATFPRITLGNNVNNYQNSTFWLKSSNYLRLKYVEIGYSLPEALIGKIKLKKARLFINAVNLVTITKFKEWDPEYNDWAYPNQRILSAGVNIQF